METIDMTHTPADELWEIAETLKYLIEKAYYQQEELKELDKLITKQEKQNEK